MVIIGERRIELATALPRIGTGDKRPNRLRIECKGGFRIGGRRIEFSATDREA
jgi:hypothetical protein